MSASGDLDIECVQAAFDSVCRSGSGSYVELRSIDPSTHMVSEDYYSNVWNMIIKLKTNPTKNHYVGRAMRALPRGDLFGVTHVGLISFDVDVIREHGPAPEASLAYAKEAIETLAELLKAHWIVSTGNGYQLWVRFFDQVDIRGRRWWWSRALRNFERHWIGEVFAKKPDLKGKVKFDPQFDIPRIIRLPGTFNHNAGRMAIGPRQMAIAPSMHMEDILEFAPDEPDLRDHAAFVPPEASSVPERFWKLLGSSRDTKLVESWRGIRCDLQDCSPSGQDCALAQRLKIHGFSPEEAYTILRRAPSRNDGPKRPDYYRITIEKVYDL